MTAQQRIVMLKDYLGLSYNKLASETGLATPQILYDIKNGKIGISKKVAEQITARYLNISAAWLITGEGYMLRSASQTTNNVAGRNVCGVNVNGRDIDIKCPTEYETLLEVVNAHNRVVNKMQSQLDKAQSQIDELIAILKAKI